jgi:hypothetical protein
MLRTHLKRRNDILHIVPAVHSERLWDDEQGVCERLDAQLAPSFRFRLDDVAEVRCACNLERSCARHEALVFDGILDSAQAVADRVLDLADGVCVGAWRGSQS